MFHLCLKNGWTFCSPQTFSSFLIIMVLLDWKMWKMWNCAFHGENIFQSMKVCKTWITSVNELPFMVAHCRSCVHESNGAIDRVLVWGVSHLYFYHSDVFKVLRLNSWLLLLLLLFRLYFHIPKWFLWPLYQMRYVLYAILNLCVHQWINRKNNNRISNELRWFF